MSKNNDKIKTYFNVRGPKLVDEKVKHKFSAHVIPLIKTSSANLKMPINQSLELSNYLSSHQASIQKLAKAITVSSSATERLGKWVKENQDFFSPNPKDVLDVVNMSKFDHVKPAFLEKGDLNRLNESSEQTTELLNLIADVAHSSEEANQQMASFIKELSDKQGEANRISVEQHSETLKSMAESDKIARHSFYLTLIAAISGVISILISLCEHVDVVKVLSLLIECLT